MSFLRSLFVCIRLHVFLVADWPHLALTCWWASLLRLLFMCRHAPVGYLFGGICALTLRAVIRALTCLRSFSRYHLFWRHVRVTPGCRQCGVSLTFAVRSKLKFCFASLLREVIIGRHRHLWVSIFARRHYCVNFAHVFIVTLTCCLGRLRVDFSCCVILALKFHLPSFARWLSFGIILALITKVPYLSFRPSTCIRVAIGMQAWLTWAQYLSFKIHA